MTTRDLIHPQACTRKHLSDARPKRQTPTPQSPFWHKSAIFCQVQMWKCWQLVPPIPHEERPPERSVPPVVLPRPRPQLGSACRSTNTNLLPLSRYPILWLFFKLSKLSVFKSSIKVLEPRLTSAIWEWKWFFCPKAACVLCHYLCW